MDYRSVLTKSKTKVRQRKNLVNDPEKDLVKEEEKDDLKTGKDPGAEEETETTTAESTAEKEAMKEVRKTTLEAEMTQENVLGTDENALSVEIDGTTMIEAEAPIEEEKTVGTMKTVAGNVVTLQVEFSSNARPVARVVTHTIVVQ